MQLIEKDGKNFKIQAKPKNLGNNPPPPRNPNGPYKKKQKRVTGQKLPAIKQAGH
jgi:hypothetical protein